MAKVSDRAVLVYQIERRSRSDCVHEQVAKRIANVRFTDFIVSETARGTEKSMETYLSGISFYTFMVTSFYVFFRRFLLYLLC